ncbi:MAG: beta galactosidase jelly roll domain-containing protein [Lachnospiraceae bacterium]|nr:beta galactosidase jelly roll domain-containing protein [Lachnospiraceae bacterium]
MKEKMEKPAGNFLENIHKEDYLAPYQTKKLKGLMLSGSRDKESLNGVWHFGIDQYDNCLRAKFFEENYYDDMGRAYPLDYSFDTWETIQVPSCWNLASEYLFLYEGSLVYTRKFRYQRHDKNERVFLRFGGAAYVAYVFVNQKFVGFHEGASTPFEVEVTELLRDENRIVVVVNNTRKRTNVPCENTDWFNYGGLYRDVEILRVPETFIKDFSVTLNPDGNGIRATVKVDGVIGNGTAMLKISELDFAGEINITDGKGEASFLVKPKLWSPENPKLYDYSLEYLEDKVSDRIGFREIKVVGTDIYLNGEPILLKGICAHEDSVFNGKAVTEAEIRENYRLAKEMNCNYMRLAHYPHSEQAAIIADEMGIMLWEEIPVYWAIEFENEAVYDNAENQLTELITRDKNRASVIIWSVGNENVDTDVRLHFMSRLAKKAKALDPARLVSAACLYDGEALVINDRLSEFIDIIGINEYFGWYQPDFSQLIRLFENSKPTKPVVICETGADARSYHRGPKDDLMTEDNQLYVYQRQIEVLSQIPYVKGISPWILFDFRCPRRLHSLQNYLNLKGLLSADKSHKKLAFYAMKEFFARWGE